MATKKMKVLTISFFGVIVDLDVNRQAVRTKTLADVATRFDLEPTTINAAFDSALNLAKAVCISNGLDQQPSIRLIFDRWIRLLKGHLLSDSQITLMVEELIEKEVEFLVSHAKVNKWITDLIIERRDDVHILVLEDTCYTSAELSKIARRLGINDEAIEYRCASETGYQKLTGKAFRKLAKRPDLHIGTEVAADAVKPNLSKVRSWIVYDLCEQHGHHKMGTDVFRLPLEGTGPEAKPRATLAAVWRTFHKHPIAEISKLIMRRVVRTIT